MPGFLSRGDDNSTGTDVPLVVGAVSATLLAALTPASEGAGGQHEETRLRIQVPGVTSGHCRRMRGEDRLSA